MSVGESHHHKPLTLQHIGGGLPRMSNRDGPRKLSLVTIPSPRGVVPLAGLHNGANVPRHQLPNAEDTSYGTARDSGGTIISSRPGNGVIGQVQRVRGGYPLRFAGGPQFKITDVYK